MMLLSFKVVASDPNKVIGIFIFVHSWTNHSPKDPTLLTELVVLKIKDTVENCLPQRERTKLFGHDYIYS